MRMNYHALEESIICSSLCYSFSTFVSIIVCWVFFSILQRTCQTMLDWVDFFREGRACEEIGMLSTSMGVCNPDFHHLLWSFSSHLFIYTLQRSQRKELLLELSWSFVLQRLIHFVYLFFTLFTSLSFRQVTVIVKI